MIFLQHVKKSLFILVFLFPGKIFCQQNPVIDSLLGVLAQVKPDTEKINVLNSLLDLCRDSVKLKSWSEQAFALEKKTGFQKGEGNTLNEMAYYYRSKEADYVKAVDLYTQSLAIRTEINDRKGMAQCYLQLAIIDAKFKNYDKAISQFNKAEAISVELKNLKGQKSIYQAMANMYMEREKFDSALIYFRKAESIPYKQTAVTAITYINLVSIFIALDQLDSAFLYIHKTDSVYGVLKNTYGPLWNRMNLGEIYLRRGDTKNAIVELEKAYSVGESTHDGSLLFNVLPAMIEAYSKSGDYKKSFSLQTEWIKLNDSLKNQEKANAILGEQFNFETAQKDKIEKLENDKREAEHTAQENRQRLIIYSVSAILSVIILFAVFIFRSYRQKKKANEIITKQKEEVEKAKLIIEEKQKEIIDSILYAKRIQQSLLPKEKYIERELKKHFAKI